MDAVEKESKLKRLDEEMVDLERQRGELQERVKDLTKRIDAKDAEIHKLIRDDDNQIGLGLDEEPSEDELPRGMPIS